MTRTATVERIPARMTPEVYEKIAEAARTVGATLNQFIVQSALEKADAILERERVMQLSAATAEALFAIMENPPEPNDYLKDAMKQRRETLCRK